MSGSRLLLLGLLLVTVLFFPLRVLQFIALLYLAVIGLSWLYSRLLGRGLSVRRRQPVLRAHAFEPLTITLVVENRSPLPAACLSLLDTPNSFFASEPGYFLTDLRAGQSRILAYTIESQQRGQYSLGPAVIGAADPLGLFPFRKAAAETQTLIVYPEVLPLRLETMAGLPAGSMRTEDHIYEDVTRYRSLREYVAGDPPRRISWKASARTGQLKVMDYLPRLYTPVLILLNLNEDEYPLRHRHHRIERAVTLAASLVGYFLGLRQEIGLIASARLAGEDAPPLAEIRGTHEHATTLLELLARALPASGLRDFTGLLFSAGIEIPLRSRIEVITPSLREEQWGRLHQLRKKGSSVEVFMIGEERPDEAPGGGGELRVYRVQDYGGELIRH